MCVERSVQVEALLDDGDEDIDGDRDPNLRLHRIFRRAVELLDPQVLLDPLEEKLHLPSIFVEGGNGQGWKSDMVGQKHQRLAGFGVPEADAPQMLGVILAGVMAIQSLPLRRQGAMDWSQIMPVVRSVGAE